MTIIAKLISVKHKNARCT